MPTLFALIQMDTMDWIAIGFLVFFFGGILAGFFFYLRTAYKQGGWNRVGRDFLLAIAAIIAFAIVRMIQNHELGALKDAVSHWFK